MYLVHTPFHLVLNVSACSAVRLSDVGDLVGGDFESAVVAGEGTLPV